MEEENKESREEFLKKFEELFKLTEKEFSSCPWIRDFEIKEAIKEIKEEIEEVYEEVEKGDKENLAREAGDVFRDSLLLLFLVSKETGISKERILDYLLKKIRWRKPWVEKGEKISKEKAVEIWKERKGKENIEI